MHSFRAFFLFWTLVALLLLASQGSNARTHFHKKQNKIRHRDNGGPAFESPVPSSPATNPPPNDTSTYEANSSSDGCIYDVRSFGAVGDGSTDDTEAFRSAWKEVCSVESATLLVPSDGVFMITSTIFSGPCQPGIVFQVILLANVEYKISKHRSLSA